MRRKECVMLRKFEIAAGSVAGRDHIIAGRNNQDAYAWRANDEALSIVVCDGCSSQMHSEVGAKIGSAMLATAALRSAYYGYEPDVDSPNVARWWGYFLGEVYPEVRALVRALGGRFSDRVAEYLLFTLNGVLITPSTTFFYSLGDGVVALNGQVRELGPFPGNEPPYLAYDLTGTSQSSSSMINVSCIPTKDLESFLIGTDGLLHFLKHAHRSEPGRSELVGSLSQFWEYDRYFANPDMVRRKLVRVNRDVHRMDDDGFLTHEPGLLPDDTTLVVLRRRSRASGG